MALAVIPFGVRCYGCGKSLTGLRYQCRQCEDINFCKSCYYGNREHTHPFRMSGQPLSLTYPGDSKDKEVSGPSSRVPSNPGYDDVEEVTEEMVLTPGGEMRLTRKVRYRTPDPRHADDKIAQFWSTEVPSRFVPSYLSDQELVDDKLATIVNTVVQESWKADLVGEGKDARNLTHKNIKVTQVQRIWNKKTWEDYEAKLSAYRKRAPVAGFPDIWRTTGQNIMTRGLGLDGFVESELNEVFLFHGTTPEKTKAIIKQGLDPRIGKSGMFGNGVYFTESSTKADQYTDEKNNRKGGEHYMFLARVLLGRPFFCVEPCNALRRPPCASCKKEVCEIHPDQFDSVIGTHRDRGDELLFREFIVYKGELCYPEYLITYVRCS